MTKKFYFLCLLVGLVCGMCFTSCCDTDDVTPIVPGGGGEEVTFYLDNEALPAGIIDPTTGAIQLTEGGELTLPFVVEPASLASQIVLSSADPSIVAVDGLKLIAKKPGKTTIYATAGNYTMQYDVEVQKFVDRDENGNLKISEINFPDANFRTYVKDNFDTNSDDVLTDAEIAEVTSISVNNSDIKTLEGVEFFTALTMLECRGNQLTSLDVSKNTALQGLGCNENQLTSLDLSKNTALTVLYCNENQLTSLDLSKNTALTYLFCNENQLTSLDVSGCTELIYLYCCNNQLTSLDVSKNTELQQLLCFSNQLTSLNVSKNTALQQLACYSNQLTSLDVSQNTALTSLNCGTNQLTQLDVTKNTALEELHCYSNQLTSLDVTKNTALEALDCNTNQLTSLDVSQNTKLTDLNCYENQITSLDLSNNPAMDISGLNCDANVVVTWPVS